MYPTDSDYESARGHVYNHRYLYNPAVFVFSTTTAHVQSAVQCAVQLNLGIAPRSGGHSYEDYSLGESLHPPPHFAICLSSFQSSLLKAT